MKDILLKVAKAYPNDSARGIARLDPNALLTLRLSPGDIIEIEGKRLQLPRSGVQTGRTGRRIT